MTVMFKINDMFKLLKCKARGKSKKKSVRSSQ